MHACLFLIPTCTNADVGAGYGIRTKVRQFAYFVSSLPQLLRFWVVGNDLEFSGFEETGNFFVILDSGLAIPSELTIATVRTFLPLDPGLVISGEDADVFVWNCRVGLQFHLYRPCFPISGKHLLGIRCLPWSQLFHACHQHQHPNSAKECEIMQLLTRWN